MSVANLHRCVLLTDAPWIRSCDTCRYQEGRHYCLRHGMQVKNMDTVRCADHQDRGERGEADHMLPRGM